MQRGILIHKREIKMGGNQGKVSSQEKTQEVVLTSKNIQPGN